MEAKGTRVEGYNATGEASNGIAPSQAPVLVENSNPSKKGMGPEDRGRWGGNDETRLGFAGKTG